RSVGNVYRRILKFMARCASFSKYLTLIGEVTVVFGADLSSFLMDSYFTVGRFELRGVGAGDELEE
ncbi:MAG: hypothetical protein WCH61_03820, partial [bacterium]